MGEQYLHLVDEYHAPVGGSQGLSSPMHFYALTRFISHTIAVNAMDREKHTA